MTAASLPAESILRTLAGLNRPDVVRALARRVGADEPCTARVVAAALPALLVAVARTAASESGARSLLRLLRDHGSAIPGDVVAALRDPPCPPGDAITQHLLAARRSRVEGQLARQAGIDPAPVSRIVAALAPLVLGAVERQRPHRQHRWSPSELAQALGAECGLAEDLLPGCIGVFEELIDLDSDPELDEDVGALGAELLRRAASS
jgi:hypothetical protein